MKIRHHPETPDKKSRILRIHHISSLRMESFLSSSTTLVFHRTARSTRDKDGSMSSPKGVLDEFYTFLGCSKERFDESAADRLDHLCRCLGLSFVGTSSVPKGGCRDDLYVHNLLMVETFANRCRLHSSVTLPASRSDHRHRNLVTNVSEAGLTCHLFGMIRGMRSMWTITDGSQVT